MNNLSICIDVFSAFYLFCYVFLQYVSRVFLRCSGYRQYFVSPGSPCPVLLPRFHLHRGYRWALFGYRASSSGAWDEIVFHDWTAVVPTAHAEFDELRQPTDSWSQILNYRTSKQHQTKSNIVRSPPKLQTLIVFLFQNFYSKSQVIQMAAPFLTKLLATIVEHFLLPNKLSQWWINRRRCSSWQTSRSCASTDVCMLNSRRATKLRRASVWRVQSLQESALRHSTSANCVLPKKMWEVYIISFVILDSRFLLQKSHFTNNIQFFRFEDNPASWCCR